LGEKILVVDDEAHIVRLVTFNLQKEGFETLAAYDGKEAKEKILQFSPDLVILDLMLPEIDGLRLLQEMREEGILTPVIMLTAKGEEADRVAGLELGGDDYVSKPFSMRELIARVKAVLRRTRESEARNRRRIKAGRLTLDLEQREVFLDGGPLMLTPKEFELLSFMVRHRGRVLSRDMLLERVWGYDFAGESRIVDVHISHLREKIEKDPRNPELIKTVRGVGYRFC